MNKVSQWNSGLFRFEIVRNACAHISLLIIFLFVSTSLQAYEVSPEAKLQKCKGWAVAYDNVDWDANPDIGPWCGKDYAYYYNLAIKDKGPTKGKKYHEYQCERTVGQLEKKEWESRRGSVCTKGYDFYAGVVQEEGLKACKSKIWDYDEKKYKSFKEDEQSIFDFNKRNKRQCPKGFTFYKDLVDKETAEYRKDLKETVEKQRLYTAVYSEIGDSQSCQRERVNEQGIDNIYSRSVKHGACPSLEAMVQAEQARKDKAGSEKVAELKRKEMAEIARIANGVAKVIADAEMLALAKSKGFDSYNDYQLSEAEKQLAEAKKIESLQLEEVLKGKTFKAELGCVGPTGRSSPAFTCLHSAKIDGRFQFRNGLDLTTKSYATKEVIALGLNQAFELHVQAKTGLAGTFYVKVTNISTGEEVFYDERELHEYNQRKIKVINK